MINSTIKVFTGAEITAQDFAILLQNCTSDKSGVLFGCTPSIKDGTTVHITTGWCVLYGRIVKIEEGDLTVTLPSSGTLTRYLLLTVDLGNSSAPTTVALASSVPTDSTNFNFISGKAYLSLGQFTIASTGVSSVTGIPAAMASGADNTKALLAASSWSSSTVTVDSEAYYWYDIYLTNFKDAVPEISLAAVGTVPTKAERAAFAKVVMVTVDTSAKKLRFYASTKPSNNFVVMIKGAY